jgi:hypothetical protein
MAQTQVIVIPADWPEPDSLYGSLIRCGIQVEGTVALALERYALSVAWLRRFADEIRRRVHEGHSHPRRQELFSQQGLAANALEYLRALMRATIRAMLPPDHRIAAKSPANLAPADFGGRRAPEASRVDTQLRPTPAYRTLWAPTPQTRAGDGPLFIDAD